MTDRFRPTPANFHSISQVEAPAKTDLTPLSHLPSYGGGFLREMSKVSGATNVQGVEISSKGLSLNNQSVRNASNQINSRINDFKRQCENAEHNFSDCKKKHSEDYEEQCDEYSKTLDACNNRLL